MLSSGLSRFGLFPPVLYYFDGRESARKRPFGCFVAIASEIDLVDGVPRSGDRK